MVTVEIQRAAGLTARRHDLDAFAGNETRFRNAFEAVRQTSPVTEAPDVLIDAMRSGQRLTYHPECAVAEIARFRDVLPLARDSVRNIQANAEKAEQEFFEATQKDTDDASRALLANILSQKKQRTDARARAAAAVSNLSQ
jgi:hypothetical protein